MKASYGLTTKLVGKPTAKLGNVLHFFQSAALLPKSVGNPTTKLGNVL